MKRKIVIVIIGLVIIAVGLWIGLLPTKKSPELTIYEALSNSGYSGTEEQLIASLIGELSPTEGETEMAYNRAKLLGYKGSPVEWAETLAGVQPTDERKTMYALVCENGYSAGLENWLKDLVPYPERLGEEVTEYNLACENGFEGSFIQWLMALIGYQED